MSRAPSSKGAAEGFLVALVVALITAALLLVINVGVIPFFAERLVGLGKELPAPMQLSIELAIFADRHLFIGILALFGVAAALFMAGERAGEKELRILTAVVWLFALAFLLIAGLEAAAVIYLPTRLQPL